MPVLAKYKKLADYPIRFITKSGNELNIPANKFIYVVELADVSDEFGREVIDNLFFTNLIIAKGYVKNYNRENSEARLIEPILAEKLDSEIVKLEWGLNDW